MEDDRSVFQIELIEKIEVTRADMISLGLEEGFTSENTLQMSQFLDELLNQLHQIRIRH
ncbi:aspartyl-phosphate phosphatase Spo0E family protein [Priestia koreensis]|uniref:aspartyl-phosphate phosphatase Spo0E family protein n=1 Tax=Priestia koreensis TaxID=284581 RepID=UPI0020401625|nr:aspartyl-phosphate phosphatase Spo0E family protein [Priestia koreensis]MCM3006095.1 aspartyl-phosphate phosphatase Spo0E family protein [Priestia koreensis]